MRVLVCGGRDYSDRDHVRGTLSELQKLRGPFECVIHGCALGADTEAGLWAQSVGVRELRFPADWNAHGRAAGPIRNKQMLVEGRPDLVVAFPGGRGTENMVQQAKAADIEVMQIPR